ncbi:serine protease 57 isoform X2 [Macaca fascicularis]|uniref:serine protease 57 isoform X2 n=1 Tax=Macaca fascicularis TaxID=9541 RepID=UPI003D155636
MCVPESSDDPMGTCGPPLTQDGEVVGQSRRHRAPHHQWLVSELLKSPPNPPWRGPPGKSQSSSSCTNTLCCAAPDKPAPLSGPQFGSWGAQIIGGHEVTPHSRPYMASVRFGGQHHCGGFLLRARWVVSAAHCFSHRDLRTGLVVLGAHALRTAEPTQQVFGISAITNHPDFHPVTHVNDICLLRLNSSAVLGPAVGLLRLPGRRARPPTAGTRCRVAGWGFVSDFEDLPPGLMEAEVRVLDLDVCNSSWKGHLSRTMLCTRSGDRHRRGFCSADSGGPLVCRNRAHGLVSFSGLWCGDPKTPDVYTQVSSFVAWIWDVVRRSSPQPGPLRGTTRPPGGVA